MIELFARPTLLSGDLVDSPQTFAQSSLEPVVDDDWRRLIEEVCDAVRGALYRDGQRVADYVRLRSIAEVLRRQLESVEADVVQLDEADIVGHPEDTAWAAEAINHVVEAVPNETAVHICFGNYGGQTAQRGFWRDLIPFLNKLHADHLVLEFARRGYDELEVFRDLNPNIHLGIGVIDIKDNEVESPQTIASRLETIVKTVGEGQLKYIHPDCGFWMLYRSVVDRKMRALVEGRDLFEGRL
jgi:5-methyltetrahydropteroyltriglutamate--homocysteine methyltransferase